MCHQFGESPVFQKIIACLCLATLAACGAPEPDVATKCMFEVKPTGTYATKAGATPHFYPVRDGTQEQADALNACVRRMTV